MGSTDNLAFMLPTMMLAVSAVFVYLARLGFPAARAWSLGFAGSGLGFLASVPAESTAALAYLGDTLFLGGFFFYGEALLIHFGRPLQRRERISLAVIYMAINAHVVFVEQDLAAEVLLSDLTIGFLLSIPLSQVVGHAHRGMDRALVFTSGLVVIDTLSRVLIFGFFIEPGATLEQFSQSAYAVLMQLTAGVFGIFFAAAALGSIFMQIVAGYQEEAERDPMTGLLNRRGFEQAISAAQRGGKLSGAVIVCDIDHFKQVNDRYGHAAGDGVIQALADALRRHLPVNAVSARFGGEEFVAFLPAATLAEAGIFAQALRANFAAQDWRHMMIEQQITASFGVASVGDGEHSAHAAIKRADQALYDAKAAGRNKVIWHGGHYEPGGAVVDIQSLVRDDARRLSERH